MELTGRDMTDGQVIASFSLLKSNDESEVCSALDFLLGRSDIVSTVFGSKIDSRRRRLLAQLLDCMTDTCDEADGAESRMLFLVHLRL